MQRGGQLVALVGQMVSVAMGHLADQAVIAQEAQMPTDASRELMLGSSAGPGGPRELLAQTGIADARNGEARVTDRLNQGAIFAAQVQGTDPTALLGAAAAVGVEQ